MRFRKRLFFGFAAALWLGIGLAAATPDSKQLEAELQTLPWKQFRAVIESVPNLKADVEQYGSAGWAYVKATYKTYGWKKNIDRLSPEQKNRLAELIGKAKAAK